MVDGPNTVACGGGEDNIGIPVDTLRPHLSSYIQGTGRCIHSAYHHVATEITLTGRYMQGPIASRNGCRYGDYSFGTRISRFVGTIVVGPYLDGIDTTVRHYRMQVVALSQLELCGTVGKVGHERLRVG